MPAHSDETCWTLIRAAGRGGRAEREEFTRRYLPAVRAYLAARWARRPASSEVDDAVQEVFLACFKDGGALERVEASPGAGFRAFLFGVVRKVALNIERRRGRDAARCEGGLDSQLPAADERITRVWDRAYARALMREAAERMAARARAAGPEEERLVTLLELRFERGLPIRDIARLWGEDLHALHHEYARAGRRFRASLREVVGLSERSAPEHLDRECERLLGLLD